MGKNSEIDMQYKTFGENFIAEKIHKSKCDIKNLVKILYGENFWDENAM